MGGPRPRWVAVGGEFYKMARVESFDAGRLCYPHLGAKAFTLAAWCAFVPMLLIVLGGRVVERAVCGRRCGTIISLL